MGQLDGRVALVTGAARGQGRAHARALAAEGAVVVASDIAAPVGTVRYPMPTPDDLEETVALIAEQGGKATPKVMDVRDAAAVDAVVADTVSAHGHIDVLVANAGICAFSVFEEISDDAWEEMLSTNLGGAFRCIRAVLPHMKRERYGRIVTISSGAGRCGMLNLGHYVASKWGVIGLTKTVALETAGLGITANVVCPSTTATPMVRNDATYQAFCPDIDHPTEEDALPRIAATSPMGVPWLQPEDITRAVMYLVTDPGLTSGSVIDVNLATSASRT
jgi:SDR family mycofactocin-dependent oxidoreductase